MSATAPAGVLEFRPAIEFDYAFLADAFTRGFENYIVPMFADAGMLEMRARPEAWELSTSFVAFSAGALAGILCTARRGWTTRVAAMGVTTGFRGRGVGRAMMEHAIAQARQRGDAELLLEVIDSNAAAIRLYESVGLKKQRNLVGFEWANATAAEGTAGLVEIDPAEFSAVAQREYEPRLPWQMRPQTLANYTRPNRAFSLEGHAFGLIGDPAGTRVALRGVAVPGEHRRCGHGSLLLRALDAKFPGRTWIAGPIIPAGLADDFFLANGFTRTSFGQWEMRLSIS